MDREMRLVRKAPDHLLHLLMVDHRFAPEQQHGPLSP